MMRWDRARATKGGAVTPDAAALPAAHTYVDPDCYEAERRAVFAHEWTAIGATATVASPGDYLSVWVAGYPLVVVNDAGTLRAFHNVCRHRAGPLVDEASGTCTRFVCRYHGWTYALDGR